MNCLRSIRGSAIGKDSLCWKRALRRHCTFYQQKSSSEIFVDTIVCSSPQTKGACDFSSVSKSEVSKFSQLSEKWWDPRENPLIAMNTIRVQYIVNQLSENGGTDPLIGLKALDVGCGGGLLSESLARLGASVTSIDPSSELVEQAQLHAKMDPKTRNIDYRGGWTVEELAQVTDTKFDIICLLEVIEHVSDVDSIISSIQSLLKPNGKLFLSTLNRTAKSRLIAIVGAEYLMRYLPVGTHDWNKFRSPEEVSLLMERGGLEQVDVSGMVLASPPLSGRWDWQLDSKDRDINWIGTYQLSSNTKQSSKQKSGPIL